MIKKYILVFYFLTLFKVNIANNFKPEDNLEQIMAILKNYKRHTTILEVTDGSESYVLEIAPKFKSVYIILILGNNYKNILSKIKEHHLHNVVILNPQNLGVEQIETLAKCEHFDVSIIHDFTKHFKDQSHDAFQSFTKMGDYIFFETQKSGVEELMHTNKNIVKLNSRHKKLFLLKSEKPSLELARFTQGKRKSYRATQDYKIESDFNKKLFKKKLLENPINWAPGINLVTFVMLYGIHPSNKIIYENIKSMTENIPYHNDLMIGNMVIQGYKLKAIDFKDKRRNANMKKCINRALRVFDKNSSRLKDPYQCMQEYYDKK